MTDKKAFKLAVCRVYMHNATLTEKVGWGLAGCLLHA